MQITAWDGRGVLTDYANKEWAGLTKDFIARRWRHYFDSLDDKKQPDFLKLEMAWVNSPVRPVESKPEDPAKVVSELFAAYHGMAEKLESALGLTEPPGNLARQGKATDDGHTEPGGSPANAIDGDLDTYWAASPSPCTWLLDLGAPKPIKSIQVFPYWGDGRYYQYVVEISEDGADWAQVVDMSKNTELSSMTGHKHVLPQSITARWVRIRMLRNSANIGVHLCEVRLFEK
jgi:alpha-N-acetylglucosaminidase